MPRFHRLLPLCLVLLAPARSHAADAVVMLPIQDALNTPRAQGRLDGSIKFYFGQQPAPKVVESHGLFVANRKTNGFLKREERACEWVFLSALAALQNRAKSVGANAVINIESYYDKHAVSSTTQFECHKGMLMAGVALRGEIVRSAAK